MEKLENIFAKNLILLRKEKNLTQVMLAEILNYSDKSISKWERAEAIPDVVVLKQIADLFGVTIDYLITEHDKVVLGNDTVKKDNKIINSKGFIFALSEIIVWVTVLIAYFLLVLLVDKSSPIYKNLWLTFIYGVVISFILSVVFFSIWRKNVSNCISVSGLIWAVALAIYLTVKIPNMWLIFLVAIPIQILAIVWFVFVKIKRIRRTKLNKN